ncbi:MAG: phosphoglucosamine mutase [Runella slithyformis]|nr:MAG: phosphoglucosamine mutase [Runella slithyformis]TAF97927.1 MAG: phosphoglucosamine mutase [Runella sp.]TAG22936.1 MAG: phosphoglucosamine mutase [Cytophagales bacterium]TAG41991.1 MAG: phosphoglucosamine mutase [Cytophagia bacterium]TAE98954.1 MAG: phosphoglucosamine mutase [Runella slithyformis]
MALIKSISGIRGTIGGKPGDALTPIDIVKFSSAFGTWLKRKNPDNVRIIIGRDARLSGEMVSKIVAATLQSIGFEVIDLDLSTTPTVEIAVVQEQAAGGIILTASHNPIQWNALKLLNEAGEFISNTDGAEVLALAEAEDFDFVEVRKLGSYVRNDTYLQKHIALILALPLVDTKAIEARNFKLVVDAVNSTGGLAIPMLLEALGVKPANITLLHCEPTGHFAHNPEPLPENLLDIIREMERGDFDLGIVTDPDVDRLAFICEDGSPFGEEYTLVAVADYVLKHKKGNSVSNLSSTGALRDITQKAGGQYFASAVGEVNVVEMMKAHQAVIGGEGNGGVIYPDLHHGRDALVGIALFLSHLAKFGKSASVLRRTYPNYHISKNKIELTPEINVDNVLEQIKKKYSRNPINDIDGVKIEFDKEWVHLRKSNTEPIIRIYSESETATTADHLAKKIIADIKELIAH